MARCPSNHEGEKVTYGWNPWVGGAPCRAGQGAGLGWVGHPTRFLPLTSPQWPGSRCWKGECTCHHCRPQRSLASHAAAPCSPQLEQGKNGSGAPHMSGSAGDSSSSRQAFPLLLAVPCLVLRIPHEIRGPGKEAVAALLPVPAPCLT